MKNIERWEKVLRLRLQGLTYQEIGDRIGRSRQRVQQLLSVSPATRYLVMARAQGKCEACGQSIGKSGHIHHMGENKKNYDTPENLRYLCRSCHTSFHLAQGDINHLAPPGFISWPEAARRLKCADSTLWLYVLRENICTLTIGQNHFLKAEVVEKLRAKLSNNRKENVNNIKSLKARINGFLTSGEIALALDICHGTLYNYIRKAILPGADISQNYGKWYFSKEWLRVALPIIRGLKEPYNSLYRRR